MKKIAISLITAAGIFLGLSAGATSTVMIDPPNISEIVGNVYNTANPFWNSISPWLWFLLGIGIVFLLARLILGIFKR